MESQAFKEHLNAAELPAQERHVPRPAPNTLTTLTVPLPPDTK